MLKKTHGKHHHHPPGKRTKRHRRRRVTTTETQWQAYLETSKQASGALGAASPQLLAGEISLFDPVPPSGAGGVQVGKVTTWIEGGVWNELWEITRFKRFENKNFRAEWSGDLPVPFGPTESAALLANQPAGTSRAHLKFNYKSAPTQSYIDSLPDPPEGSVLHRYKVHNGNSGDSAGAAQGALFRIEGPDDQAEDHWILWKDYKRPGQSNQDMWLLPRTRATLTLQEFLEAAPADCEYVVVTYQWTHA